MILGGPRFGRRAFRESAGDAADGVVFPRLFEPGPEAAAFTAAFTKRYGVEPDYAAAHAYDAVRLLAAAVDRGGLNRARICDALRELAPWNGVTGRFQWDPLGSNERPVRLGTYRNRRIVAR
jgi:branched-chain amino acid transport system substrate-binding protein